MSAKGKRAPAGAAMVHQGEVLQVSFTADGGRVVSLGKDYLLRTWDAQSGAQISSFKAHTQSRFFELAPDSLHAVVGGGMQTRLVDLASGKGDPAYLKQSYSNGCGFAQKGALVLVSRGGLTVLDAQTGKTASTLSVAKAPADWFKGTPVFGPMAVSPGGTEAVLLSGTYNDQADWDTSWFLAQQLHLLDTGTMEAKDSIELPDKPIRSCVWTAGGVFLSSSRLTLRANLKTRKVEPCRLRPGTPGLSSKGDLAVACDGKSAQVVSTQSWKQVRNFEVPAQTGSFDQRGGLLALGVKAAVVVFDLKSGELHTGALP